MKVDFSNIMINDIDGNEAPADIRQLFGNMLYMQGVNIDECELGTAIYHQKEGEPMELTKEQADIVKRYAERLPYVMRTGIISALK